MPSRSLSPLFLVRPMMWGIPRQDSKGCGVFWNAISQPGFYGCELRVINEVLILVRIILEIIEFLKTITVANESVALICDPV